MNHSRSFSLLQRTLACPQTNKSERRVASQRNRRSCTLSLRTTKVLTALRLPSTALVGRHCCSTLVPKVLTRCGCSDPPAIPLINLAVHTRVHSNATIVCRLCAEVPVGTFDGFACKTGKTRLIIGSPLVSIACSHPRDRISQIFLTGKPFRKLSSLAASPALEPTSRADRQVLGDEGRLLDMNTRVPACFLVHVMEMGGRLA